MSQLFIMGLTKGIKDLMFSAGDYKETNQESLEFMENVAKSYISSLSSRISRIAMIKGKLDEGCFLFIFRNDKLRLEKIQEVIDSDKKFTKSYIL